MSTFTIFVFSFLISYSMGQNAKTTNRTTQQLVEFLQSKPNRERMTTSWGAPVSTKTAVLTAGPRGPILLQDVVYLDEMSHFDRERIPERVVHARGSCAHGELVITHDITRFTKAKIFSQIGKRTPCFWRFSTVAGEMGSADTARDPRGFAMKYYTEEGNWDLVGNNAPIFFIRDPILFPSFIHSQKRNPRTNLHDPNMVWDFWSQRPEAINMIMRIFSDLGTPDGYRKMDGFGSHTFKLVNANGTAVFCKFHFKSQQGVHNLTAQRARELQVEDPDYAQRDLYNTIENGNFPKWDLKIQVMTFAQAAAHRWNPFDVTKTWPEVEFPLISVGTVTLNRNPENYFEECEQAAFAPARMVPGVEASPDKMLQGRLFAYPDTQLHRLGVNFMKLPINCPFRVNNTQINGYMRFDGNEGGAPVYHPNTFNGPQITGEPDSAWSILNTTVARFESGGDDNYDQPAIMWKTQLDEGARGRLVENIAGNLGGALPRIQCKMLEEFTKVNVTFGQRLRVALNSTCGGCPATGNCAQRVPLITQNANNQTVLLMAVTTFVNQNMTSAQRLSSNSYLNSLRSTISNRSMTPAAKITQIVNTLASFNSNNSTVQRQMFSVRLAQGECPWGTIGEFVRCGTQNANGANSPMTLRC